MSQDQAARELGISRPSLTQLENGNRSVSGLELDRLARLYGRPVQDFFREQFRVDDFQTFFRANVEFEGDAQQQGLRSCIALSRELNGLEQLLEVQLEPGACYGLGAPNSKGEAIRQGNRVALEERRRLALGDAPIDDICELLESEGIRTAVLGLPRDISGLTLCGPEVGRFVAAQQSDARVRQRFSFAHEYAHVLIDGEGPGRVSRRHEDTNIEVRANAFAAAFLMPSEGVRNLVASLGKTRANRASIEVFDGDDAHTVGRANPGAPVQLHDAIHVAHRFGVSRNAAIYRMHNLGLIDRQRLPELLESERTQGRRLAQNLGLHDESSTPQGSASHRRLTLLGLEAVRRDVISRRKYIEILELTGLSTVKAEDLAQQLLMEDLDEPHDILDYDE